MEPSGILKEAMENAESLKVLGFSLILFSGWLYLRLCPYRQIKNQHLRADRFAFALLGYALISYTVGVFLVSVIERKLGGTAIRIYLFKAAEYAQVKPAILLVLVIAPVLGFLDSMHVNWRMRRDPIVSVVPWRKLFTKTLAAANARFIRTCENEALRLLHRALILRKPVMFTLKSGKVYVGQPVGGIGDPSISAQSTSIKIIPLASGYRKSETHKVDFTTRYKDIFAMMVPRKAKGSKDPLDPLTTDGADLTLEGKSVQVDIQDIGIVILWTEIQTLSIYDENIYKAFQVQGPPDKPVVCLFGKDSLLSKLFCS